MKPGRLLLGVLVGVRVAVGVAVGVGVAGGVTWITADALSQPCAPATSAMKCPDIGYGAQSR